MRKRAVLFDLDGTLINTLPEICGNLNRVRECYRFAPLKTGEIQPYIGKGAEYLIQNTFSNNIKNLNDKKIKEIVEKYIEFNAENPAMGGNLYPKVRETLETLKGWGFKLAVATNKPTKAAQKALDFYLPGFFFDYVAGPEKVSEKKPSPVHLFEVLDHINVRKEHSYYCGDDPVDLETAERAKIPFFAATWGFGGVKTGDDRDLSSFSDLLIKIKV